MNRTFRTILFYIVSFTWGLPLTLLGGVGVLIAFLLRCPVKRFGPCLYAVVGNRLWGGLEGGPFFFVDRSEDIKILEHEYGHGIQNCFFGPLMLPVISIPSAIRYQIRLKKQKRGKPLKGGYYDIWFEKQASKAGEKYFMKSTS